jgi:hypothetical protein
MSFKKLFVPAIVVALGVALAAASIAQADPAKEAAPPDLSKFKLPKGWTMEDVMTCMAAGVPGEMHKKIAKEVGTWKGKQTMWMGPDSEPSTTECSSTVSPLMDGRFVKVDFSGIIEGMGPYNGMGIVGYDNVSQKIQAIWLDNHGTGMSVGTGELSADGKTLTIEYSFTCPLTKKPATMRQVETYTSPTSKTMEMFGADPKTGKEYKMMKIEMTKK